MTTNMFPDKATDDKKPSLKVNREAEAFIEQAPQAYPRSIWQEMMMPHDHRFELAAVFRLLEAME